ncbi:MAG: ABC transporter substrate-binding protein, partial [Deltaproteobacteria bacterium]|nr:ABC transporter substrate-binding protein [Deltaproteobacteria bacterium]
SYFENSELAARGLPSPAELEVLEPLRGKIPEEVFTQAYQPPQTDGSGKIRHNLRRATELLSAAGWKVVNGRLTNVETGEPMAFEILLSSPGAERGALPFKKNLERLGVEASVRTVDTAQYRQRMDTFDFDVTTQRTGQTNSPGNEQREFWSSESAKREGGRNLAGIQSPAVDELIELVIAASSREELITRVRALDRVLLWGFYMIPHFYIAADRLLYWDRFGRPEVVPTEGLAIDTWWFDEAKAMRLDAARGGGG